MKKINVIQKVKLQGVVSFDTNGKRWIDLYILMPNGERVYGFRKSYSTRVFELCKNGIPVNDLIQIKTKTKSIMRLVDHTKVMMPYFMDYYNLPKAQ